MPEHSHSFSQSFVAHRPAVGRAQCLHTRCRGCHCWQRHCRTPFFYSLQFRQSKQSTLYHHIECQSARFVRNLASSDFSCANILERLLLLALLMGCQLQLLFLVQDMYLKFFPPHFLEDVLLSIGCCHWWYYLSVSKCNFPR